MGALESLLATSNVTPPSPSPATGGALEKLLAGNNPASPPLPAPTSKPAAKGGSSNLLVDDLVGGTADAIDLVWTGLFAAPVAMAGEALTRAQLGANNLLGIGEPKTRRDIGRAGQATAARLNESLGTPVRSTLKALGLLSDRPMAVEKAMQAAMSLVERDAASVEERTGGAVQKEDVLMGVNALFGALGAKGVQYVAKTAPEQARAKAALKELAKLKEEGNARLAAADAEALNRESGGIPREPRLQDNPAAADKDIATFDRRANAERRAYDLMQSGASTAKVEAAIKKDPAVGTALEAMRKRREQTSAFLQEMPEVPIREDGTFAPNALSAMLRRPSEMGATEFAARDAAAGIVRGPLGEPIFSTGPAALAAGNRGRSSPDPRRRPTTGSGLMGTQAPPEPDVFGAAAAGGRANPDPRRPAGSSNLLGVPASPPTDPFGAAASGGRASPDPTRRPATGSGLEGRPVQRDSLGTPLSPDQTLAVVGATGLGLAAYYASENDPTDVAAAAAGGALLLGKGRGITLEAIRALPDTATLREIRDASNYTLSTLENLPGNRAVHSKQSIAELLRRQEVTKAERDILQSVLDSVPGEQITAKQLMAGVKEATGDFELKPVASAQHADYGLENIDRAIAPDDYGNQSLADMRAEYEQNAAQLRDEGPMLRERAAADDSARFPDFPRSNRQAAQVLRTLEDAQRTLPERIAAAEQIEGKMSEPTTTIYQSPFKLGTNNHFGDPNYFAHTRSFYEGGVKHVVEMQSDLAQRAGKVLTADERSRLEVEKLLVDRVSGLADEAYQSVSDPRNSVKDVADAQSRYIAGFDPEVQLDVKLRIGQKIWEFMQESPSGQKFYNEVFPLAEKGEFDAVYDAAVKVYKDATRSNKIDRSDMSVIGSALEEGLYHERRKFSLRKAEIDTALAQSGPLERVSPMLKRWDRRLVREELAASARGRENPAYKEAQEHLASMQRGADDFMQRQGRLKPEEAARYYEGVEEAKAAVAAREIPERFPPEPVVRFATADTVAKVEGWPEIGANYLDGVRTRVSIAREGVRRAERFLQDGLGDEATLQAAKQRLADAEAELAEATSGKGPRFSPEHQGIYDRYNKEVTSFLKQLGGKEVTDSAGHTWIEVPTEGSRKMPAGKRVQQFGAADPELVKTLGAVSGGVAVASLLSDDENKLRNAALAAVGVSLAMFGRSRVHGLSDMAKSAVGGAERYLGAVSTRVGNMSPRLLRRMREHERGVLTRTNAYLQAIGPFVEGLRKVPEALRAELDAAILSGEPAKVNAVLGRTGDPALVSQFKKARTLLNQVGAELMQAGKLKGLLSDYYPRIVTDVPGLLAAIGATERTFIEKQIAEASRRTMKEALRDLTPFEVSQIINKALKGAPQGNGRPGFLKGRVVDKVTADLTKFYAPASESLPLYLRAVSKELERARFFGENLVRDPVSGATHLDESIGNLVREEQLAGRINSEQAMELGEILRSRFGPGERGTARPLQAVKNLAYAGLLGHVTSAITQLGDVAISAAAHGILPTLKAIQQNLTRKPARATVHDLGMIDHMAEEIVSASRTPVTVMGRQVSTAKFLEKAFKYSGFSWVDSVGKNVSIQASKNKLEGFAKTPAGIKRLQAKYGKAYSPQEMQQLVADLRSGELTELVKGVLFSELSDVQPISKLEVPQAYLDNPNGRVLYMLKTFMLKQADIVRREVYQNIRKGNYRKAIEQGTRFGLALGIGGASTQWINNWLLGRDQEPELSDIPTNALKTFGWSQYTLDKIGQGKPLEAAADVAAPPYKMFDTIIRQDPAAIQYMPIVGRIYYARDWFDLLEESGSEKANRRLEREQRRKEREE